ncbi:response regulator [Thiorhodovibrio frisius]|uniref:Response regulator with CheY-like receiver domain and winged-helix DNA-binding domain n=1 Tax=Thiorhodovibrio frisius TaxID=631362 RepID=H8Z7T8_9GAMM|nr:response regulator [Thiorhodovibrio frisius]EIC20950.1 response regulator with CheY-like receiver domain and winged-helix DNA-binding domain [Thiorhodovibrio frisius]WPL22009.1 Transcriptional regulatory protein BaeR [Thiorhodovibrio frisius]
MSAQYRILVVEDEPDIADVLVDYLESAGFVAEHLADGLSAVARASAGEFDLMLLDLMLPGMDGLEVCREVRKVSQIPIVMVTARVEELDRLLGLELGADDYVCKPFSPREVVARVKAVLRRTQTSDAETEKPGTALVIDEDAKRVCVAGKPVELTRTEYRVLCLLSSRPGRVYSRAQILELAYDDEQEVSDRAVDSHVKNIRRKIAAAGGGEPIQSVYGIGYRFET